MPCLITTGFTKDCNYRLGGLKALYFGNLSQIDSYTDADPDDGKIEAIVMTATDVFYAVEFERNTAVQTQELQVNAGQASVSQSVTFTLGVKDAATIAALKDLSLSDLVIIAVDANGGRCVLGRDNGLRATVGTNTSGTAEADFSGITFTFTGSQKEYAPILDAAFDINTIL